MFEQSSYHSEDGLLASRDTHAEQESHTEKVVSYEYRDADGEIICHARAILSAEKIDLPGKKGLKGRKIESFTLSKDASGGKAVDLLKLALSEEMNVPAYFVEGDKRTSEYVASHKYVMISSLETAFDVATVLHEFGHAEQDNTDPAYSALSETFVLARAMGIKRHDVIRYRHLQKLDEALPQLAPEMQKNFDTVMREYKSVDEEYGRLDEAVDELKKELEIMRMNGGNNLPAAIREKELELERKMAALKAQIELKTVLLERISVVIKLPTKLLERDATARAIKKMHAIREENDIDLFKKAHLPAGLKTALYEKWVGQSGCEDSVAEGLKEVNDPASFYEQYALWTYYADDANMKKDYGHIPIAPIALDFSDLIPIGEEDASKKVVPSMSKKRSLPPPIPLQPSI